MTLNQAIRRLATTQQRMENVLRRTGREMGEACVERAQAKLGTYQRGVNLIVPGVGGPFDPWEPLAPETIERKLLEGFPTPSPLKRTGAMHDAIYYTTEERFPQGFVVRVRCDAEYAVFQEFGTEYMPPRPFMMPAVFETLDRFRNRLRKRMIDVVL